MRAAVLLLASWLACAQPPDPAYGPLSQAYQALRIPDYDQAISLFLKGIEISPRNAAVRKDLAYTYLKVGENVAARDQFRAATEIDSGDVPAVMEYAFLCYETKERQQARRIFDRIRKSGDAAHAPTAERAFQNIDQPLAAGIERWKKAIQMGGESFSAHFELAALAEERDELELAAEHYRTAWVLRPERRSVLVDLGRVWLALNRKEAAAAALLAASRGGEPRAAEMARELLPDRYPYVDEFRRALELDPQNAELRRELAYLLLKIDRQAEAEQEFRTLAETAPDDLLSATQLGFQLHARGEYDAAMPLFERVLAGNDEDLANRVRAVLRIPQLVTRREAQPSSIDAKIMAERSLKAGYLNDALKYLQVAHESDPGDFDVILKLGWTYNNLHLDSMAIRWFDLARKSSDPRVAAEAGGAWKNLRNSNRRFRMTGWLFPAFSSRYRDLFAYGQVKTEIRTPLPLRPYVSVRFIGDARGPVGAVSPQYLSESSFVIAAGVRMPLWRGVLAWAEAGSAISYITGHMLPDYRGGISAYRGTGRLFGSESPGWFADTAADGVFISRFGNDFLGYQQGRAGYTAGTNGNQAQIYWNANTTFDSKREHWANFVETGPGLRLATPALPQPMYFSINLLRGVYLTRPRAPFSDVRAGFWYAFTH